MLILVANAIGLPQWRHTGDPADSMWGALSLRTTGL
jgi:hypothetical protein